jgi:hypothetical protein
MGGDLSINGMVVGSVVETKNKVIIDGAVFSLNGDDAPAIEIGKNLNKEVIISNVRILSQRQKIHNGTGQAGIMVIDNADSKSKLTMRDVKVNSRNVDIASTSTAKNVCAAIICGTLGHYDSSKSISVTTSGQTNITAIQGTRPDYRPTRKN